MNETVITLFGTIDRYWYNKNYLKYFLDKAKGQPVRLKVSSYGGDVAEAVAMSALMAEHGNVTVEFISFNASAATVLAFGAKSIEMHEDGMCWRINAAWEWTSGASSMRTSWRTPSRNCRTRRRARKPLT